MGWQKTRGKTLLHVQHLKKDAKKQYPVCTIVERLLVAGTSIWTWTKEAIFFIQRFITNLPASTGGEEKSKQQKFLS
jgi:hypothetical protein